MALYANTFRPEYATKHGWREDCFHMIQHSGHVFKSNVVGKNGHAVWPIEELMSRWGTKYGPRFREKVRQKVAKANIDGCEEGQEIKGLHIEAKRRLHHFRYDCVYVRDFIKKWGRNAYDNLDRRFILRNGHRKAVSRVAFINGH